ncbi:MAG: GNAT family N-acetyltransferase [bacterium]
MVELLIIERRLLRFNRFQFLLFLDWIKERYHPCMIAIEGTDPRLRRLLEEDYAASLPLREELNHSGVSPRRVFLDSADEPGGALVIGNWVKVFARNVEALERLFPALEGFTEVRAAGVAPWILEHLTEGWEIQWVSKCWLWRLPPGALQRPPALFPTHPLRSKDAPLVNRHWEHGGDEESEQYLRKQIEDHPSMAIFEEERPVAWSLVHWDGAMGPCFTLPEARGRGYAAAIAWELSRVLLEMGRIPYFYTLQENLPPQRLAQRMGFRQGCAAHWFGAGRRLRRGSIAVETKKSGSFTTG